MPTLAGALVPIMAYGASQITVDWSTLDGGGTQTMTGGHVELSGTLGQFDARNQAMSGANTRVTGGFWVIPECPAIQPDYDGDCDVDQADYTIFEACASGPDIPHEPDCEDRDHDGDGDVDHADFGLVQRCFSGPDIPADPKCAD
jgi:hypothetical protein